MSPWFQAEYPKSQQISLKPSNVEIFNTHYQIVPGFSTIKIITITQTFIQWLHGHLCKKHMHHMSDSTLIYLYLCQLINVWLSRLMTDLRQVFDRHRYQITNVQKSDHLVYWLPLGCMRISTNMTIIVLKHIAYPRFT